MARTPSGLEDYDPLDRPTPAWTPEEFIAAQGREIGVTPWHAVTQEKIDAFAVATEDLNFVHVNPERAKERGLPGPIAHGFFTLSLLSAFAYEVTPTVRGAVMGLNYGLDRARFITPVPVGSRVRGRLTLAEATRRENTLVTAWDVAVEIEGAEIAAGGRPALVARWLTHATLGEQAEEDA